MADLAQLEAALVKADAAGDADAARAFAGEIRRLRGSSTAPSAPPSIGEQFKSGVATGFKYGGLPGAAIGAIPASARALDEAAYATGGKVTDVAARAGLPPSVSAGLGFATNVGMQAIPSVIGGVGGKAAAPLLDAPAKRLMQSALKPTIADLRTGRAATAIQTMLDEGVNVSMGGVAKLKGAIGELNKDIAGRIATSTGDVNKSAAYRPLLDVLDKFSKQVSPASDMAAIRGAWDDFLNHPLARGNTIPVQLAQEMKQATYRTLGKKYGEMKGAEIEAQKAIARGLKDDIARVVPEVAPLNARESRLITAADVAGRRALLQSNNNPFGLTWLADHPAAALGFMADRSGVLKSLLARGLYSGRKAIPQAVVGPALATGQGVLSQLLQQAEE